MYQAFNTFQYIFPPRTKMKVPMGSSVINMWKDFPDVTAQFKLNGTRNLIYVFPDGSIQFWNRHKEQQQQFAVTDSLKAQIDALGLNKGSFHVIDGEMLEAKTKNVKGVLYVFDLLVLNSQWLIGATYDVRYDILKGLMNRAGLTYFPVDFTPKEGTMYLAENFPADKWEWMWKTAQTVSYCEGMVLKRTGPISSLEHGFQQINNAGFMMRIRKPTKNYRN